jgi:hypothetical protein
MKDLLKDTSGDLMIAGNDVVAGYSDQQQREDLIIVEKGSIKQFPEAGVGAFKFLESEDGAGLLREISLQFSADGMDVKKVGVDVTGNIIVEAPYSS